MTSTLKETDYLKAWGLFFLCATVGGFFVGLVIGALIGGIMGASGVSIQSIKIAAAAAGFLLSLPISYLCFRFFVSRFLIQKILEQPNIDQPML